MKKETHRYDDIIDLPHPTSRKHPRMSMHDRAAQFSPFAALAGHNAAIRETARLTEEKIEQSEEEISRLNEKLQILADNPGTEVTVAYFVPDGKKAGGAYVAHAGTVKKVDRYERTLIMTDRTAIPVEQIRKIESEWFDKMKEGRNPQM